MVTKGKAGARSRAMASPEAASAVAVKLDRATLEVCLEAVRHAASGNGAEEAGRASAEAAIRALLGK